MSGVALVGFSGSLIKDVVKESVVLSRMLSSYISDLPELPPPEGTDQPEATKVVIGKFSRPSDKQLNSATVHLGVFFILFAQIL
jgi:hypothetical protein